MIKCSCHGLRPLEIKCPFKYSSGFSDLEKDASFPLDENLNMKRTHKYYHQIQLQISLCKAEYGYFFVFSPAEPTGLVCIVKQDLEFIENLRKDLVQNFMKHILPEIVTRWLDTSCFPDKRSCISICRKLSLREYGKSTEANS